MGNKKDTKIICKCYGKEMEFNSRQEATDYFMQGLMCSEGSEQNRYANILSDLWCGRTYCTDDED